MDTNALGFPFRLNEVGQVATMAGDENLRAKIVQVVLTAPGERVNLPSFGCGLHDLVFDPNIQIDVSYIRRDRLEVGKVKIAF